MYMAKKNLKCPYCNSDLSLEMGYSGADWETIAGEGSGYGYVLSLECMNNTCASVFDLVHAKNSDSVSVVLPKYRHFVGTNLKQLKMKNYI